MMPPSTQIPISSIILDESIYPRKAVDPRRLGLNQKTIHNHLLDLATLPNLINADLVRGFTVAQVTEKHGWPEPMAWSLALEGKTDHDRFKARGWGFRTWDQWEFNDCDNRFGDDWPGRIPAQLIAHILRYFSQPEDLVLDPMAGGGVTPDTCLAMGRRCWAFDMKVRPDTCLEIEPFTWEISSDQGLSWPVSAKGKPDLVIFDPPYFDKKAGDYDGNKHFRAVQKRLPGFSGGVFGPNETTCQKKDPAGVYQCGLAGFSEHPGNG